MSDQTDPSQSDVDIDAAIAHFRRRIAGSNNASQIAQELGALDKTARREVSTVARQWL